MATIRKIERQSGSVYKAIIKHKGTALKSKTFSRKGDAQAWVKRVESDLDLMESLGSRGACVSFSELVDEYIQQWTGKSFQAQQGRAAYWRSTLGHLKLPDITTDHIRQAIKNLEKGFAMRSDGRGKSKGRLKATGKKRSPSTSNRYRSTLSAIFRYAMIEGYLPVNPVSRIPSRKVNNLRNRYLSEIERSRLLSACKDSQWPRLHLAVLMAMTSGMRKSELFGLRWCDVDFERGLAMLADTKNGEPRHCPIPDFVMTELSRIRQVGKGLLFPSESKPDRPFEFKKHWLRALADAGIENFRWHDLRHTAASMLVQNGATLYETAGVLGHKSLETTKRYAHLSTDHKAQLVNRVMAKAVKL